MTKVIQTGKELIKVSTNWLGRELTMEVNRVCFRTQASVLVHYGDTTVLGLAQVGNVNPNLDYFPLSIDYEEKYYAAGKMSSSRFVKREGKPSDEAVLIGRLIDRPIRPLFPKGYKNECQVVSTVLSMDPSFRPDAIAMLAASTALMLTGAPFDGPVAGLRIGIDENGEFKAFMSRDELAAGKLDLFVAGGDKGILMVEAGAKEVPEDTLVDAFAWAEENIKPALEIQKELKAKVAPAELEYELDQPNEDIQAQVDAYLEGKLGANLRMPYLQRNEKVAEIRKEFIEHFSADYDEEAWADLAPQYSEAFGKALLKKGYAQMVVRLQRFARLLRKSESCRASTDHRCSHVA